MKQTTTGTVCVAIGLVVSRRWFDKAANQPKDETAFVDVTLWGRDAETAGGSSERYSQGAMTIQGRETGTMATKKTAVSAAPEQDRDRAISDFESYPLREFRRRVGIGEAGMRRLRKEGLRVVEFSGAQSFILGRDWNTFLASRGNQSARTSEEAMHATN